MSPNIIPLESIQIASPCRADWNAMQKVQGNGCVRFCPSCGQNVYDLSGFTRDEAMRLIEAKEGHLCLRLHRRSDGTVITSDCPVGQSSTQKRGRIAQFAIALAGLAVAFLGVRGTLFNRRSQAPLPKASSKTKLAKRPVPTPTPPVQEFVDDTSGAGMPPAPGVTIPIEVPNIRTDVPAEPTITMGAPPPFMPEPTEVPVTTPSK